MALEFPTLSFANIIFDTTRFKSCMIKASIFFIKQIGVLTKNQIARDGRYHLLKTPQRGGKFHQNPTGNINNLESIQNA